MLFHKVEAITKGSIPAALRPPIRLRLRGPVDVDIDEMKRIGTVIVWIIAAPIIAYGAILGVVTLFAKAFGGPLEPPPHLTWSEFKEYRDSGRWFQESMSISVVCTLLPSLFLFWASRRGNKKRIELGDIHSPTAQGVGGR